VTVPTSHCVKSVAMYCVLLSVTTIFFQSGDAQDVFAAETPHPFATFDFKKMDLDIEDGEIDMTAIFTLGAGNNGFDLAKDVISLQLTGGTEAYSVTIPAGSFKSDKSGEYKFQGSINRVKLEASIRSARGGAFEFEIETAGAILKGFSNPVTVRLAIGDNGGSKVLKAEIE
jgi:hypothetical protein